MKTRFCSIVIQISQTAKGVYLPEGHLILRAKSKEPRAIVGKNESF
jgi:hypothetical protein